ncbi:hypothetical protein, partial [Fulvivirga lutimaris]|uniref:hypothetical protein n=1 Tax=Fulvivirga lutimaris TaxID=1819566 RepID=UPI001C88050C
MIYSSISSSIMSNGTAPFLSTTLSNSSRLNLSPNPEFPRSFLFGGSKCHNKKALIFTAGDRSI